MLNRTHEYDFDVDPLRGRVRVSPWQQQQPQQQQQRRHESSPTRGAEETGGGGAGAGGRGGGTPGLTVFEALSKSLDSEELSALVRIKLGVDVDEAKEGYRRGGGSRAPQGRRGGWGGGN